jgi:hypothetical protein
MWRMRRKRKEEEKKQLENRLFQRKLVHMHRPFNASMKYKVWQ